MHLTFSIRIVVSGEWSVVRLTIRYRTPNSGHWSLITDHWLRAPSPATLGPVTAIASRGLGRTRPTGGWLELGHHQALERPADLVIELGREAGAVRPRQDVVDAAHGPPL